MISDIFFDYTLRTVSLGALILGIFSGALGCFSVLRRQSLVGDAISHAALPGIAIAFLLTLSKEPFVLLLGAAIAGLIGTLFTMIITKSTIIKQDAALGIILSVFFGFGLVLLTYIQKLPTANQAGLKKFLFGNASALVQDDLIVMAFLGLICLIGLLLLWKEFKLLSFDPLFGQSIGFPMNKIDIALTALTVIAIVIGLQTVGVVLMSAMIIAPASAARQWTDKLHVMVILAAIFGGVSGVAGAVTSSLTPKLPTGPTIVVYLSLIVAVSLLLAPGRGILWEEIEHRRNRKKIDVMSLMLVMFHLSQSHKDPHHAHDVSSLSATKPKGVARTLEELKKIGWVEEKDGKWALTLRGLKEGKRLDAEYGGENAAAS